MAKPFRRVTAPVASAVTLCLDRTGGAVVGEVKLADGALFSTTGTLPVNEAFGIAVHVANEGGLEIVVIDPRSVWKPSWGELQG
ncbi:MAG: hypothetical protein Q7T93_02365 [Methylobacterium sp.]|jgi:hypothetical protein|uniref:hypothetical protein n=1 Tax=unclassified Methylobacterium TaxID=2615210 RepID=UPI0006F20235|nr:MULTISPECIES: hypothetical protein [unclassified Methylobacterium]KQP08134.1 hypothetical protein ASF28_13730 [Methylobacterium sp. Leaf99]MDO9425653.1 hypothetical protein [Methylobacterium sp.]TXM78011.1 hypothetical protein FV218_03805 [Methylobacterium sp. WL69]